MTGNTLALVLISVTLSACAQVLLKLGVSPGPGQAAPGGASLLAMLLRPGVVGGLALYGLATLVWLRALSQAELSQAYPFVGLGLVLTSLLGHLLFNEALGPSRLLGTVLVVAGVLLVARS